jgi:hypothetical protein
MRGEHSVIPALLDANADPAYAEVDHLLGKIGAYQHRSELQQADLLQAVFGVACDQADDGTPLKIGRHAPCPVCGVNTMKDWEPAGRVYTGSVQRVRHETWNQLTLQQKQARLHKAVAAFRNV